VVHHLYKISFIMLQRPQHIGIKAIEIYFPSQVCLTQPIKKNFDSVGGENSYEEIYTDAPTSALTKVSSKSLMALVRESTPSGSARLK
jgi:hypothetical protein